MYDLLGYESLFQTLRADGLCEWAEHLESRCRAALSSQRNSDFGRWANAIESLKIAVRCEVDFQSPVVTIAGSETSSTARSIQSEQNRAAFQSLMPWRKGPFRLDGISIDTEWRSDFKWERISHLANWEKATVLDVGCGNGYFGWRMLGKGADHVVGLDPYLLYVMQHAAVRRFAGPQHNYVLPVGDDVLTESLMHFDVVLSMGVLYHRANPIEHLIALRRALRPAGRLVLETLVVEGDENTALVPADRYAKMRNVWFLPTVAMLTRWLQRSGFEDIQHEDSTATTSDEQRKTEWMEYESLSDFIDPQDPSKTIEGYPAPLRAILTATRR